VGPSVLAVCAALLLSATAARAEGLSAQEAESLRSGYTVTRSQVLESGSRRYVGGVTYIIVDARADQVALLLDDVRSWRRFVPKTRDARIIAAVGDDSLVEFTHGSGLVKVAYTLQVRRDHNVVRFWMDPLRPHDIEDAWGFFRAEPMPGGQTLVTYGVLIDIGSGLMRDIFEDRVRKLALEVPDNLRSVVLRQVARGQRASR
jgi:hypothetical protein